jgi:hypothetical protein
MRSAVGKMKGLLSLVHLGNEVLAGNYTPRTVDVHWPQKPDRTDLINAVIARNGYRTYLEIGCRDDDCFRVVQVPHKVGVDPASGGTLRMTSDEFFAANKDTFDIIFIDGLHTYEQVLKDIVNAAAVLNDGGTIVMHDCLPTSCLSQFAFPVISLGVRPWNGDVWKAFIEVRTMPDLDAAACMIDHGVGVIKKRKNSRPLALKVKSCKKLKYSFLVSDYKNLLNAVDFDGAVAFAAG